MSLKKYIILLLLSPFLAFAQNNNAKNERLNALEVTHQITSKTAMQLADLARIKADELGKKVSVAIVDASGQVILLSRGDGVGVHNTEASRRKAFTAVSTKTATLILGRNAKLNPDTQNLANLPELLLLGGGVPLYFNNEVIGAIGVSGGGGAENDDLIARAASIIKENIITK